MSFKIEQGILQKYDEKDPKKCIVMQLPDGYIIRNVQLPNTLSFQTRPKEKSIVLLAVIGSYTAFLITHLRDPLGFLEDGEGTRGFGEGDGDELEPGEVYLESAGDPSLGISGFGSSFHLGNDGTITLASGKQKDYIIIGGEKDDDENKIICNADNVVLRSNLDLGETVQSTFRFDEKNLVELGNYRQILPPGIGTIDDILETPVAELKIEYSSISQGSNITLRNKNLAGVDMCSLTMTPFGASKLKTFTSLNLEATTNMELTSILGMTLDGLTINLNSGTLGVARLNDTVTSNIGTDPAWWTFWQTLSTLISAIVIPNPPAVDNGLALKLGLATLFATIPLTTISKITTSSTTVKAGN